MLWHEKRFVNRSNKYYIWTPLCGSSADHDDSYNYDDSDDNGDSNDNGGNAHFFRGL